jgi:hypothetical protein
MQGDSWTPKSLFGQKQGFAIGSFEAAPTTAVVHDFG